MSGVGDSAVGPAGDGHRAASLVSRLLLAAGGIALAISLFLPWFEDVSGWEHFAWADVPLAIVAADLVVTALLRPLLPLHVVVVILCAAGIAVVLGHGFAPDDPIRDERDIQDVGAGAYVALAALSAGAIGALATWPRHGATVLLVAGAVGILAALLSGWGSDAHYFSFTPGQSLVDSSPDPNGFARWQVLDAALVLLAIALVAAAELALPREALAGMGLASLAAAVCIVVGARDQRWTDEGIALGLAKGPLVALLALAWAIAGLALVRPPASAESLPAPAAHAG
jgi:hypothetical protein